MPGRLSPGRAQRHHQSPSQPSGRRSGADDETVAGRIWHWCTRVAAWGCPGGRCLPGGERRHGAIHPACAQHISFCRRRNRRAAERWRTGHDGSAQCPGICCVGCLGKHLYRGYRQQLRPPRGYQRQHDGCSGSANRQRRYLPDGRQRDRRSRNRRAHPLGAGPQRGRRSLHRRHRSQLHPPFACGQHRHRRSSTALRERLHRAVFERCRAGACRTGSRCRQQSLYRH